MNDDELRARMNAEAEAIAAAETDEDDGAPLPDNVSVSRPNRARSRVLQVRLNPEEYEAVERVAAARGLPVSTVARDWVLRSLNQERMSVGDPLAAIGEAADKIKEWLLLVREEVALMVDDPGVSKSLPRVSAFTIDPRVQ